MPVSNNPTVSISTQITPEFRDQILDLLNQHCEYTDRQEFIDATDAACSDDMAVFALAEALRKLLART